MVGDGEDMLRVVTKDVARSGAWCQRLIVAVALKNVTSRLASKPNTSISAFPIP
jgi:Lrp/AsnC family transcriptional regulator, cysteine-sensing transcriptional activator